MRGTFLCHNLTWLILEQETREITAVFWKHEQLAAQEKPGILPVAAQQMKKSAAARGPPI
ncbi:MAG TPA: hypothetical protein VG125_25070 [Pirellulales bacterium]|nr:hypothetical protein [Pirellulales bacterium]